MTKGPPSSLFCSKLKFQKAQRIAFKYFGTTKIFGFFNFCSKFSKCLQRVLLHFFDILQQSGFSKSRKGPPFHILKTLRFLSLRYSADVRLPVLFDPVGLMSFQYLRKELWFLGTMRQFFFRRDFSPKTFRNFSTIWFFLMSSVRIKKTRFWSLMGNPSGIFWLSECDINLTSVGLHI